MRASQINENITTSDTAPESYKLTPQEVAPFLAKLSSEALTAMKASKTILYRGTAKFHMTKTDLFPGFYETMPREERGPLNSSSQAHNKFVQLQKMANWPLNRSNSLFAVASRGEAANFGTVGFLLPLNGFKCAYNAHNADYTYNSEAEIYQRGEDELGTAINEDRFFEELRDIMDMSDLKSQIEYTRLKTINGNAVGRLKLDDFISLLAKAIPLIKSLEQKTAKHENMGSENARLWEIAWLFENAYKIYIKRRSQTPHEILANNGWRLVEHPDDLIAAFRSQNELMIRGKCLWIIDDMVQDPINDHEYIDLKTFIFKAMDLV